MWLKRLIPVLMSQREEAKNLAAFHFCMEAEIKRSGQVSKAGELFAAIGATDHLRRVASSPSGNRNSHFDKYRSLSLKWQYLLLVPGFASKYAAQTLKLIGEPVPHKLSQQVPTWSIEDVAEWVKQIGFKEFADSFEKSRVDGDLLLQLDDQMLRYI